jgi:DNA-binding CsgD family transcriptional regulator
VTCISPWPRAATCWPASASGYPALIQDRVVPDFLAVPAMPEPLVLNVADPSVLAATPERLRSDPFVEQRVLQLLPTSTYLQIADTLYISRNTVKTHLRSIYQKLGVASRSAALERAVDLRLL